MMTQWVGIYTGSNRDNGRLAEIMRLDKYKSLKYVDLPQHINRDNIVDCVLFGEFVGRNFYALNEDSIIEILDVNIKQDYSLVYDHPTDEMIKKFGKMVYTSSLSQMVVRWINKGIYPEFKDAIQKGCPNIKGLLTTIAKTMFYSYSIYLIGYFPVYSIIKLNNEYYFIYLQADDDFEISKRVEMK